MGSGDVYKRQPLINGEFAFIAAFEAEAAESRLRLTVSEPVAALALAA